MLLRRPLQASIIRWQNFSTSNVVSKKSSPLGELRKKSGYSLSLCKEALAKNENDVTKAFEWLDVSLKNHFILFFHKVLFLLEIKIQVEEMSPKQILNYFVHGKSGKFKSKQ